MHKGLKTSEALQNYYWVAVDTPYWLHRIR